MHVSSVAVCDFSQKCACAEAATEVWKAVYVNRKRFGAESNLIYRIESNRPAEGVHIGYLFLSVATGSAKRLLGANHGRYGLGSESRLPSPVPNVGTGQGPCPLPACASHWPAWFGHAPGVEQFGEPLFWEDFLFFGHLAHGFA